MKLRIADPEQEADAVAAAELRQALRAHLYATDGVLGERASGDARPYLLGAYRVRLHEPTVKVIFMDDPPDEAVAFVDAEFLEGRGADRIGQVHALFVRPECRRRGVGRQLMAATDRWFTVRGVKEMQLTVPVDDEAALEFFAALGYIPAATQLWRRL